MPVVWTARQRAARDNCITPSAPWYTSTSQCPRLSYASPWGYRKMRRSPPHDPMAGGTALLPADAILSEPIRLPIEPTERIRGVSMMLISFESYARAGDRTEGPPAQLRAPQPGQRSAAASSAMAVSRQEHHRASKADDFNVTKAIGVTYLPRAWLPQLRPFVKRLSKLTCLLFEMNYSWYLSLLRLSRQLGRREKAHLHRLRHGGASADFTNHATDLPLMDRGPLATVRGVARYIKPAGSLHQLSMLSEDAMARASGAPQREAQVIRTVKSDVCIICGK